MKKNPAHSRAGFFIDVLQQIIRLEQGFFELFFVAERESQVGYFYASVEENTLVAGLNRQQRVCESCAVDVGISHLTLELVVVDYGLCVVVQMAAVGLEINPTV
jgi:hypothetical protein